MQIDTSWVTEFQNFFKNMRRGRAKVSPSHRTRHITHIFPVIFSRTRTHPQLTRSKLLKPKNAWNIHRISVLTELRFMNAKLLRKLIWVLFSFYYFCEWCTDVIVCLLNTIGVKHLNCHAISERTVHNDTIIIANTSTAFSFRIIFVVFVSLDKTEDIFPFFYLSFRILVKKNKIPRVPRRVINTNRVILALFMISLCQPQGEYVFIL